MALKLPNMIGTKMTKESAHSSSKKKAVIKEYEKLYGTKLTEAELDEIIEESFTNPDVSRDTKEKVKKKIKEKKDKKPEKKVKKD